MVDAVQAVGNMVGGIASYETGIYNRDVSRTMATEEERAGADQETRIREAARMAMGQQVGAQGADGFAMGTGSALDALTYSQVNAALDALTARREATGRARAQRMQGDQAYSAGSNAMLQGMFGAAASVAAMKSDWASARAGTTPAARSGSAAPPGGSSLVPWNGPGPAPRNAKL